MLSLNIQLQSLNLSKEIADEKDTIRVSITTVPDGQKQAQTFELKKMNSAQPSFKIKMNDQTEKIIFVFRKQNFFSDDHIIASTVLHSKDIHIFKELINSEHKKVSIFEPIQNQGKNNNNKEKKDRRIVGNMEIEFSLSEDYSKSYTSIKNANQFGMRQNEYSQIDVLLSNKIYGNQDFLFKDPINN